jgi:KAP family P-loop domain
MVEQDGVTGNKVGSRKPGGHDAITSRSQDQLHRGGFAGRIARQVALAPRGSSIVLAVTGQWGSGKTSVLNMVAEELEKAGHITKIEFNPWLFSTPEELVGRFFAELSAELIEQPKVPLRKVGEALQRYGTWLAPIRFVPGLGQAAGTVLGAAKAVGESLVQATDGGPKSLRRQHRDLSQLLDQQEERIVIVLDDIDRLRSDEVREVMRLVRLTADLPNVTFLLAFDRTVVEAALTEMDAKGVVFQTGRGYVEKIVQEIYDLPAIRGSDLEELLLSELDEVVGRHEHGPFDGRAFLNVFHRGIKPLFTSVRDIRRYLSILPVALEDCGTEVALADVLALEALRLMVPESFALLPAAVEILTAVSSGLRRDDQADKRIYDALIAAADDRAGIVRGLIAEVFPASRRFTDRTHYGSDFLGEWRRSRRVAHRDVLQFYVDRTLPKGVLPAVLVDAAFRALGDEATFAALLDSLTPEELPSLLMRLEDFESEYPIASVESACVVLMNQYQRLRRGREGMFGAEPTLRLARVVIRLLPRVEDESARTDMVTRILARVESLSAQDALINWVGHVPRAGHQLVPKDAATRYLDALVERVRTAEAVVLATERDLTAVLYTCVGHDESAREWVRTRLEEDSVFMNFLRSALQDTHKWNTSEVITTRAMVISWPWLEAILDRAELRRRVEQVAGRANREDFDAETLAALGLAEEWLHAPPETTEARQVVPEGSLGIKSEPS